MTGKRTIPYAIAAGLTLLLFAVPATAQDGEETCDGPKNISATVQDDGILIEWDEWTFARAYDVYRAEGNGEFVVIGQTSGDNPNDGDANEPHETSFFDSDVEAGASYTYKVQAYGPPPHMSDICGSVTATAIPVFPTIAAASAAAVVGLAGYVAVRRKNQ